MKIIKLIPILFFILFTLGCSSDNDDQNNESTLLFDMLYSGTYTTNLRDTESSNPPTDKDYIMTLYSSKGSVKGELKIREHIIPFTARKYESSKYPNYNFFEIIIKNYNGVGNNAEIVYEITSSTGFSYWGLEADNETIGNIIYPLIGEYFYQIN